MVLGKEPEEHRDSHGDTEYHAFVGAAVRQQHESQGQHQAMTRMHSLAKARPRSQYQCSPEGGDGRAPVRVHPVAENAQSQRRQYCTEECRRRRYPGLQHPADRPARRRRDQQLSDPWMAENLSGCEYQAMRRWVHGHVGRVLNHVEGLEMIEQMDRWM